MSEAGCDEKECFKGIQEVAAVTFKLLNISDHFNDTTLTCCMYR